MHKLPLNISNDWLNIIIGIATLIIGLTSFGIELGEVRYLNFFKSRWFRIPTFILYSGVIVWASVIKDKDNDVRNFNDSHLRDSLNQQKFDESLSKSSIASAETMAKYYLKYKASQHNVEELVRDSSKTKIVIKNNSDKPLIEIANISEITNEDTLKFIVNLFTAHSMAYHVRIKYCNILRLKNDLTFVDNPFSFNFKQPLTSSYYSLNRNIIITSLNYPTQVYFYIYGSFIDENNKRHAVNILESYNFQLSKTCDLTDKEYLWISDFIQKNGIAIPKLTKE